METREGFLFWSQETHFKCMLLAGVTSNMCCGIGSPQTYVVNNRCKRGPCLTIWVSLCSLDRHSLNAVWWKAAQYQRREIKQVGFHRHAYLQLIYICIFVSVLSFLRLVSSLCEYHLDHFVSLSGKMLSMGYGFVQYKTPKAAQKAMRTLQVNDHLLLFHCCIYVVLLCTNIHVIK